MNFTITIDFSDGLGPVDYSSLIRKVTRHPAVFTDSFRHATGQARVTLMYDWELLSRYNQTTGKILAIILNDGSPYFTGLIPPTTAGTSGGDDAGVSDLEIEIMDLTSALETEITSADHVIWTAHWLYDSSAPSTSIVHRLLSLGGISSTSVGFIPVQFSGFAVESGTPAGVIEELLYEHGYGFTFDASGIFTLVKWRVDEIPSDLNIIDGNDGLIEEFGFNQIQREAGSVVVSWWTLKSKTGVLLFNADLPLDSENKYSGEPIWPGDLYPPEAMVQETWWDYQDSSLSKKVKDNGTIAQRIVKDSDFTQIVLTQNHALTSFKHDEITVTSVFENKRAQIIFENTGIVTRYLYWCNIYADVIYRGALNTVSKAVYSGIAVPKKVDAPYILTQDQADTFTASLASIFKDSVWSYSFKSPYFIDLGTLLRIQESASNINSAAMVVSSDQDPETLEFRYRAIGVGAVVFGSLIRKTTSQAIKTGYSRQQFLTYHDDPAGTPPSIPTGDGNQSGWHSNRTALSIWESSKTALLPSDGTWSSPVLIQGPQGDPGIGLILIVESTNGEVFKPGESLVTFLIAHVFENGVEITDSLPATRFRWRRVSRYPQPYPDDDASWDSLHISGFKTVEITVNEVADRATFFCDLTD